MESAGAVDALARQLESALGIGSGQVVATSAKPTLPGATVVLKWPGGTAEIDPQSGLIAAVQSRTSGVGPGPLVNEGQLDSTADKCALEMGWKDETLKEAGFRPEESALLVDDMDQYRKTWVAYTSQGIQTDGLIEVRLDARDGSVFSYFSKPGMGDVQADLSAVISQETAQAIARAAIEDCSPGEPIVTSSQVALATTVSKLMWFDAKAVTGGKQKLIWVIELVGRDPEGVVVGGSAYVDAMSGQVVFAGSY